VTIKKIKKMESPREPLKSRRETRYGVWEEGEGVGSLFWIRGPTFLEDNEKTQAGEPVLRLVHLDLFQGPTVQQNVFPRLRDSLPPDFVIKIKRSIRRRKQKVNRGSIGFFTLLFQREQGRTQTTPNSSNVSTPLYTATTKNATTG